MACKATERETILNIVLGGKTGNGKSATGNSILNRTVFKTSRSSNLCTELCHLESARQNEAIINVIDTPGLMDTLKSPEEIFKQIEEAMSLCEGGFNAFILVLRHDVRFTEEEFQTYQTIKGLFGPDFLKICIIVFTREDVFELNDSPPFEQWLQEQKGMLTEIIKECSSRVVLFYNNSKRPEYKEKRQAAVSQLLKMINDNDMLYSYENFIKAADSRKRITIEAKLPQLQAKYQMQLNLLQAEYEKTSNYLSDDSIQSLLNQAMKIMQSINEDANGTDVLNDFKNSISNQLRHINELMASKNRGEKKMPCKITEKASILNIVLVGKTGSGKSATGNSLLNRSVFKTSDSSNSCTELCQLESARHNEIIINVIDTPGLMDTLKSQEEILKQVEEAMSLCEGGFNAFILVLRCDIRYTDEEFKTYNIIKGLFGPDFLKICIIVFARGDVFELNNSPPFEQWLQEQKGMLKEFIKECNSRVVLFYNSERPEFKEKRQAAVSQLLKMIDDNGLLYTDENFIKAADSRKRITIEAKLPQLQAKYQMQLSLLQAEYEKASNDLSDESIQSLLNQAMKIMQSINEDANGTEVLNDFKNSIINQFRHINKLMSSKTREIKIQKLIKKNNLLKKSTQ